MEQLGRAPARGPARQAPARGPARVPRAARLGDRLRGRPKLRRLDQPRGRDHRRRRRHRCRSTRRALPGQFGHLGGGLAWYRRRLGRSRRCPAVGRGGYGRVPAAVATVGQHHVQVRVRRRMPAQLGAPVGLLGAAQIAALLQQPREMERAGRVAALVGPAERLLGALQVVALLQQHPQAHRSGGVAQLVGGTICLFGGRQIVTLFELDSHVERVIRISLGQRAGSAGVGLDLEPYTSWAVMKRTEDSRTQGFAGFLRRGSRTRATTSPRRRALRFLAATAVAVGVGVAIAFAATPHPAPPPPGPPRPRWRCASPSRPARAGARQ